jgi:hypothetical protein
MCPQKLILPQILEVFNMTKKIHLLTALIALSMVFSSLTATSVVAQTNQTCEQCGMVVDATSQAHFKIVDSAGNSHYAECMMCALKLLPSTTRSTSQPTATTMDPAA